LDSIPIGIGLTDYYPVPWSTLKYDTNLGGYRANLTASQLEKAPKYTKSTDWTWNRDNDQRVYNLAHAQKSAEAEDGVSHLATQLVDHHPLDAADLVAVSPIDSGAVNFVAADQVYGFF
jgi:hypothetical protein